MSKHNKMLRKTKGKASPPPEKCAKHNCLEWASSRGFPDSMRTMLIGITIAITFSPYLGGSTIWVAGTTPVTVPKVSEDWFWIMVFITPLLWSLLVARFIGGSISKTIKLFALASIASIITVALHVLYPAIALGSISQNFNHTYRIGFLESQTVWNISHDIDSNVDRLCYFRTYSIDLSKEIPIDCALRIQSVEIEAGGYSKVDKRAAFDFEIYIGTAYTHDKALECVPHHKWQSVNKAKPINSELEGRVAIGVESKDLGPLNNLKVTMKFNLPSLSVDTTPLSSKTKEIKNRDIHHRKNSTPKLQMAGWTFWGSNCNFSLEYIDVRVKGCLLRGLKQYFENIVGVAIQPQKL